MSHLIVPIHQQFLASGAIELGPIATTLPPTGSNGGITGGVCVRGNAPADVDNKPPNVGVSQIVTGPPKKVIVQSYDSGSGLASIAVDSCTNCTAETPPFTVGTQSMVYTTATKIDQTKNSSVEITATDVAGNQTIFDPVDLTLESEGVPTVHRLRLSPSEHILMISNGRPGMSRIELRVNQQRLPVVELENGERKTIDIGQYMLPKDKSEVTISGEGKDHATAFLVFTEP